MEILLRHKHSLFKLNREEADQLHSKMHTELLQIMISFLDQIQQQAHLHQNPQILNQATVKLMVDCPYDYLVADYTRHNY